MSSIADSGSGNEKKAKISFFPTAPDKIPYKGSTSTDPLSFSHYNADEMILGKPMKEWLRFSACWWHTFVGGGGADPFGAPTYIRDWEDGFEPNSIELYKRRVDVAFEFFSKLGVEYYCFHDFDVAPEGSTIEESWKNLDIITDYMKEKQDETGVKLLWATQNLFSNPRYMNGGMTNPDVDVFCYAAAQIQKVCDINHKLGGLNHVFWGGREGYQSLLNTDFKKECDHMASMYRMAVDYKQRKGYTAQFLIEPKPREPAKVTREKEKCPISFISSLCINQLMIYFNICFVSSQKHQYDYDAQTSLCFLHEYGLIDHFKLNIEPNHTTLVCFHLVNTCNGCRVVDLFFRH
jgi:xylose isomerase